MENIKPEFNEEKIAIVCDGPFQLLSGFNIAYALREKSHIDLFLRDRVERQFPGILDRLGNTGVFEHVYSFKDTWRRGFTFQRVDELLFPSHFLKNAEFSGDIKDVQDYDSIYISTPMTMQKALHTLNPKAKMYRYDEGVGTYCFQDERFQTTKLRNLFLDVIHRGLSEMNPVAIYLNNPALYAGNEHIPVYKQPSDIIGDEVYRKTVYNLFQYPHNNIYKNHGLVFMSSTGFSEAVYAGICKTFEQYSRMAVARQHPAEPKRDFGSVLTDQSTDLWELVCADQISDDHILVSLCSTACFSPKFMYNKEPYLIFTYRYVDFPLEERGRREIEDLVQKLKHIYRNPEKIFVPNSHEELINILDQLVSRTE